MATVFGCVVNDDQATGTVGLPAKVCFGDLLVECSSVEISTIIIHTVLLTKADEKWSQTTNDSFINC